MPPINEKPGILYIDNGRKDNFDVMAAPQSLDICRSHHGIWVFRNRVHTCTVLTWSSPHLPKAYLAVTVGRVSHAGGASSKAWEGMGMHGCKFSLWHRRHEPA